MSNRRLGSLYGISVLAMVLFPLVVGAETLYLNNTGLVDADDNPFSELLLVEIDAAAGTANATTLTTLDMAFADAFACSGDDSKCYVHDKYDAVANPTGGAFGVYDVLDDTFTLIGDLVDTDGEMMRQVIGAAFEPGPDGVLHVAGQVEDTIYTVDVETAVATAIGRVLVEGTESYVDFDGADIVFTADGRFYVWTNRANLPDAPNGLYEVTLPDGVGDATGVYLGLGDDGQSPDSHRFTGLAVRENGLGNVVGSNRFDELHEQDADGNDVAFYTLMRDGEPLGHGSGDMHHSFDCFLSVDLDRDVVSAGEAFTFDLRLVHNRPQDGLAATQIWVEDAAGDVVARRTLPERTFRWGDDLTRRFRYAVPESFAPGNYTMWVGVGEMRQGTALMSAPFTVVAND